jgi:hypothetical protein
LAEVLAAASLAALLMGSAAAVFLNSVDCLGEEMDRMRVNQTGRHLLDRICGDLRMAAGESVLPLLLADSDFITYQKVIEYGAKGPELGPVVTIAFEPSPGESVNGQDDNGDYRIDEGSVTYTEGASAPRVMATDICGLRFNNIPAGISVGVQVAVVSRSGIIIQNSFRRDVKFRN